MKDLLSNYTSVKMKTFILETDIPQPIIILESKDDREKVYPIIIDISQFQYLGKISEDYLFEKKFLVDYVYELEKPTCILIDKTDDEKKDNILTHLLSYKGEQKEIDFNESLIFAIRYQTDIYINNSLIEPLSLNLKESDRDKLHNVDLYNIKLDELETYKH